MKHEASYLIVGGDGGIGSSLVNYFSSQQKKVIRTTRRTPFLADQIFFDLRNTKKLPQLNCNYAFICAGITNITQCEKEPHHTAAINITATMKLVAELLSHGCKVVFISSSAVFDGNIRNPNEDCPYSYQIEYGRQKAETEQALVSMNANIAIVRITKVSSINVPIFSSIVNKILANESLELFSDLYFSPISHTYLCAALNKIATSPYTGIFHLSGTESISYTDFARVLAKKMGKCEDKISAVSAKSVYFKPRFASLGMKRTEQLLKLKPQPLQEFMSEMVEGICKLN